MGDESKDLESRIVEKLSRGISELKHPEHKYLSKKIETSFTNKNLTPSEVQLLDDVISVLKDAVPKISKVDKIFTDAELFALIVDMSKGGEIPTTVAEKHLGHLASNISASVKDSKDMEGLLKNKDKGNSIV
jgi:hypothetical protein